MEQIIERRLKVTGTRIPEHDSRVLILIESFEYSFGFGSIFKKPNRNQP